MKMLKPTCLDLIGWGIALFIAVFSVFLAGFTGVLLCFAYRTLAQ